MRRLKVKCGYSPAAQCVVSAPSKAAPGAPGPGRGEEGKGVVAGGRLVGASRGRVARFKRTATPLGLGKGWKGMRGCPDGVMPLSLSRKPLGSGSRARQKKGGNRH